MVGPIANIDTPPVADAVTPEERIDNFRRRSRPQKSGTTKAEVNRIVKNAIKTASTSSGVPGVPVRVAEVILVDHTTPWTTGAWTPLAAECPPGTKYAIIQFELSATSDTDVFELFWRTSGSTGVVDAQRMVRVDSDEDDAQPRIIEFFLELDGTGNFEYFVDDDGGSAQGAIRLMGYWKSV